MISQIQPVSRNNNLILSIAQERLWILNQWATDKTLYNKLNAMHIIGSLNIASLEKSINEIIKRHETLRSTFSNNNGHPIQIIASPVPLAIPVIDLQEHTEGGQWKEIRRLAVKESKIPFDLNKGSLFRIILLKLNDREHVLLHTIHHIISDDWTVKIFNQELITLYEAFSGGIHSQLPAMRVQYADYAQWQKEWLKADKLESLLTYWKQHLAGAPPVLELPSDRPRPPVQSSRGNSQSLMLPNALTNALNTLSQQENVTLFMTLLAAFKILLFRYSGQVDIVVGSPVANRNQSQTKNMIGLFANTLVLRTDLSGNPSFRELLVRVRQMTLDAYAHQDLPFEKLIEELQPDRDISHSPLFQVMFQMDDEPKEELEIPGLTFSPLEIYNETSEFDLSLILSETGQGLTGVFEYNTDLFNADTIKRMIEHFQTLLEGIVVDPDQRLSVLPFLTQAERQQLLVQWNDTQLDYPRDSTIHQLFEAQVERIPDDIAVIFEKEKLTYRELNNRANQLAKHLQTLGVGPKKLVCICLDRSLNMIVGLLGILKSGGTYVPLDPAFPKQRLAFMLEDSQSSVLLTQQRLSGILPNEGIHTILIDTDWPVIAQHSQENYPSGVTCDNLAYIIYTSGSTGKPKGVQIPHRAAVNFLNTMSKEPGLTSLDVMFAVTTISFDIALLELFLPLIVGAQVVVVSNEVAGNGIELSRFLHNSKMTFMQATPATWRLLLEAGWPGSKGLKILCGGESLPRELANQLLERCDSLWNMYGPTETTVWSAVYRVVPDDGPVPIGKPIANTQIYLLDENLQPVPIGVAGTLYIGGEGLAKGYLNRPELTTEKFIASPFSSEPNTLIYNTGDLAHYQPDGRIVCLGRIDHQVKVRGFRIELGEIEAILTQHAAVQKNVVIVREDNPGDKRLVAYIVPSRETAPNTNELRSFLKEKLPDYMIPSAFVMLDALPLTPNNKVDRLALPIPDKTRPDLENFYAAPRTFAEEKIAAIWTEILGVEQVGIHDNFFDLGGDSLLAVTLAVEIEKVFSKKLPLAALFPTPTIEKLAIALQQDEVTTSMHSLVPLQPEGSNFPLFGIHSIRYHTLARYLGLEQPIYALRYGHASETTEDILTLPNRLEDLASLYIKEMKTIQPEGPYFLIGLCIGAIVAFEMAQQLVAQDDQIAMLVLADPIIQRGLKSLPFNTKVFNLLQLGPIESLKRLGDRILKKLRVLRSETSNRAQDKYNDHVPHQEYPGKAIIIKSVGNVSLSSDFDPELGWGKLITGGLEIHEISSGHTELFDEPTVRKVADILKRHLIHVRNQIEDIT